MMYTDNQPRIGERLAQDKIALDSVGSWISLLSASMFFFFTFCQMNILNTIQGEMVQELHCTEQAISDLYSALCYGNMLFIIPAGMILDRAPIKQLIILLFSALLAAVLLFATSSSLQVMLVARFILGLLAAFGFTSLIKLASLCFSSQRMGVATAVFSAWCTVGGMLAQAPAAWLMKQVGWRCTLYILVALGLLFVVVQCFAIRVPRQSGATATAAASKNTNLLQQLLASIKLSLQNPQNWLCGIYNCSVNLPIFLLGGVFGVPFLTQARGFSLLDASTIVSLLFVGLIIGNLLFGKLPDLWQRRKPPMILGALCNVAIIAMILMTQQASFMQMALLFGLCGIANGCQVMGYPVIVESNRLEITATASSITCMLLVAGGALAPFYSKLLSWSGHTPLQPGDFTRANLLLLTAAVVALICSLLITETYCKPLPSVSAKNINTDRRRAGSSC